MVFREMQPDSARLASPHTHPITLLYILPIGMSLFKDFSLLFSVVVTLLFQFFPIVVSSLHFEYHVMCRIGCFLKRRMCHASMANIHQSGKPGPCWAFFNYVWESMIDAFEDQNVYNIKGAIAKGPCYR